MEIDPDAHSSQAVTVFHEQRLPEKATPAGYAALIDAYRLKVPWPRRLSATATRNKALTAQGWRIFPARYAPRATLEGQLTFALKYEGLDLAVLKHLFEAIGPEHIAEPVRTAPTSIYSRRIWFLFEWLTGLQLDLPDATRGAYTPALDPKQQFGAAGVRSRRHRVVDNLPGAPAFCPLIFRTPELERFLAKDLAAAAAAAVAAVPRDVLARTAAFLLLADSRASYAIEGERAPDSRIQRWGRAIGQAGVTPLDIGELLRLQRVVIEDQRFVRLGLRLDDGFIGQHDRHTGAPLPDHIDARPKDLPDLLSGLISFDRGAGREIDPILAAASLAFGFVYIHPFEDGNGRLHRYLIHHTLAHRGFHPRGMVFPVSSAILDRLEAYRAALESYSTRLLPVIEWRSTPSGNVEVLNETADFYRYFDATPHAEFLFAAIEQTIFQDLPAEAEFLSRYDRFCAGLQTMVEMSGRSADLLFRFLHQNDGRLSKRAREQEFSALTEGEISEIEDLYRLAGSGK